MVDKLEEGSKLLADYMFFLDSLCQYIYPYDLNYEKIVNYNKAYNEVGCSDTKAKKK